jgi:hypothetical protein
MVAEIELFESPDLTPVDFCGWGWMKSNIYKIKVDTRVKLLAPILDAAARIEKSEDVLRRTTHNLQTRVAKCMEVNGGIFGRLL